MSKVTVSYALHELPPARRVNHGRRPRFRSFRSPTPSLIAFKRRPKTLLFSRSSYYSVPLSLSCNWLGELQQLA